MDTFSKKDLKFSIITGLIAGSITWRILLFLEIPEFYGISHVLLIIVIPILWIIGVALGYFLGRFINFFKQFGKFSAIGFTNFTVDAGIINLLIFFSGIASGIWFSVFKTISFFIAILHSYFWNKHWAFQSTGSDNKIEFAKFISVTLVAAVVNISIASIIVNLIGPMFGLTPEVWANVGTIVGSATALIFSFIGFKLVVFKK